MNKQLSMRFSIFGLFVVLLALASADVKAEEPDSSTIFNIFLPAISQQSNAQPATTTPTATIVATAPPNTPTVTTTATPTAANSSTPTATNTPLPTATPLPTETPMPTETPEATNTPTATATATATMTSTPGPTPTMTATSISFPDVTFSCAAVPASGDALRLVISAQLSEPAPFGGASFRLDFTDQSGPIDNILKPLPFQLINFFSDDTQKDATGFLSKCDQADQCVATYTVTETRVTRYIGTSVDCQY